MKKYENIYQLVCELKIDYDNFEVSYGNCKASRDRKCQEARDRMEEYIQKYGLDPRDCTLDCDGDNAYFRCGRSDRRNRKLKPAN